MDRGDCEEEDDGYWVVFDGDAPSLVEVMYETAYVKKKRSKMWFWFGGFRGFFFSRVRKGSVGLVLPRGFSFSLIAMVCDVLAFCSLY
jgi:hypothetical protein